MSAPKFLSQANSFHKELKKRTNEYFIREGKESTGDYKLFIKAAFERKDNTYVYLRFPFNKYYIQDDFALKAENAVRENPLSIVAFNLM